MCFAPQRRALFQHLNVKKWSKPLSFLHFWLGNVLSRHNGVHFFRHLNFQKWSENGVLTFWLGNVFRATTACNFSSLIWPDGSASAALASLLFDPPEPQIIAKSTMNRDLSTFSRTCIFFLHTSSLLWSSHFLTSPPWLFPPLLFHLCILSEVWLLNFLRSLNITCK